MRIPEGLEPLLDYGVLDDVLRPLMSGKEAQVYLVVSGGKVCVAKVYKAAQNRSFKNRAEYTEGRATRNSRDQRAMGKRSKHGRAQDEAAWRSTEVDMIHRLYAAGVRVPIPHHYVEGVLLMELVCDQEGNPAPRLGDLRFTPEQARLLYDRLIVEVQRMLCAGVVHGDLSDFNVLVSGDGPVIIDFPQSVDTARNPNARKLLVRDVENLHHFLRRWVPNARRLPYAEEMWELHEQNLLTPETRLEGRVASRRATTGPVNTESVLSLIRDANEDERKRRASLGIRGGEALADVSDEAPPAPAPPPVSRYAQKMAQRRAEMQAAAEAAALRPAPSPPPRPAPGGSHRAQPGAVPAPAGSSPRQGSARPPQGSHAGPSHGKPSQSGGFGPGGKPGPGAGPRPPRPERGPQGSGGQGQAPSRFDGPRGGAPGAPHPARGPRDSRDSHGGPGQGSPRGPRDPRSPRADGTNATPARPPFPPAHGGKSGSPRGNQSFPHSPSSHGQPPRGPANASNGGGGSSGSSHGGFERRTQGSAPAQVPASDSPGDYASRRRRRREPVGTYAPSQPSASPAPAPVTEPSKASSPRPSAEPRASRPPEKPRRPEVEVIAKRERNR
jgi:RIO kinase 1